MGELQLTRRAALAALTLAAAASAVKAWAAPGDARFREIRVDVSQLKAKNEDDAAQWVAAVLPGYLKQTFAKYLAPGDRSAGVLVARVDDVVLGPPNSNMSIGLGNDTTDDIEGAAVVLDGRGRVVGSYPLLSSVRADSLQNSPYQSDVLRRRVETLALSFAQWLPGKMGL
jgi:hypothetical protein